MAADESDETKITDRWTVTVPASVRERLDVEPGDKIRWHVSDDGAVDVDVIQQRYGAFDDFEARPLDGDAVADHDLMGVDDELEDLED